MKDETIKVLWIGTLIVVLECAAIVNGFNGTALRLAIAALAGLGGYELSKFIRALRDQEEEKVVG